MRLFIAIPFSEEFKGELLRVQKDMRESGVRGNFSRAENLHVTVAFLGEVKDPAPAMHALQSVPLPELTLSLGRLGNFGELLWVGLRKNDALERYVADVRAALDEAGVPYDRKKFRPHVTLVRRAEWPYDLQVSDLAEAPRASMDVTRVCLMKSERQNGKLVYTPVGEVKK
ncbi:MAG: RNA 2',3'-cyclic phosphodiesterase [Clostridia bacterium]|nr:RNA 2',3'-cyclic phosphodiesterase [Clostridia bacterium]